MWSDRYVKACGFDIETTGSNTAAHGRPLGSSTHLKPPALWRPHSFTVMGWSFATQTVNFDVETFDVTDAIQAGDTLVSF